MRPSDGIPSTGGPAGPNLKGILHVGCEQDGCGDMRLTGVLGV
jgi:hypothetical protein